MHKSPLEFSRYWAELMAAVDQASDTGLLVLTRLWPELAPHKSDPRFAPYFDEYRGRLESLVTEGNLRDFGFDDLSKLRCAVSALGLTQQLPVVARSEAKLWAYVGEPAKAVEVVAQLTVESPTVELPDESSSAGSEQLLLESAINFLASTTPQTAKILSEILAEWQAETSALAHDSAWCMLVQLGPHLGGGWGRLLKLKGDVDLLHRKKVAGNGGPSDQVTFAHQLKSADDPAVGGVYDSLAGIRKKLAALGLAKSAREKSWAMRLEFEGGNHRYHGDSLGLAAGLLAYAGLLKDEFLRHERKLSGEVGFTGGVDAEGHLTPVNNSTLKDKVTRAFFSHLKYLVVPKANEPAAREVIVNLTAQYPRRRLHLVAAATIGDVVEDRNLVRPEKLCPAAYLAKGALKYSRATKVQVPLLVVLVGLLGFVAWPIIFPPKQPTAIRYTSDGFEALNKNGDLLWEKHFPGTRMAIPTTQLNDLCTFSDIDSHEGEEVLVLFPTEDPDTNCGLLCAYTKDGNLLFSRDCGIPQEHPADTLPLGQPDLYVVGRVQVLSTDRGKRIVTELCKNEPSRGYIRIWDTGGNCTGWYINNGGTHVMQVADVNKDGHDEFLCFGFNLRMLSGCVAFFALPIDSGCGVGPPYDTNANGVNLSGVKRGDHLAYLCFPPTDVWKAVGIQNYQGDMTVEVHPDYMIAATSEAVDGQGTPEWVRYWIARDFSVVSVSLDDRFRLRRQRLIASGQVPNISESEYCERLRERVIRFIPD